MSIVSIVIIVIIIIITMNDICNSNNAHVYALNDLLLLQNILFSGYFDKQSEMIKLHEFVVFLFCANYFQFHVNGYSATTSTSRSEVNGLSNHILPQYRTTTAWSRIRNQVSCLHARKKSIKSPTAKGFKDKCILFSI